MTFFYVKSLKSTYRIICHYLPWHVVPIQNIQIRHSRSNRKDISGGQGLRWSSCCLFVMCFKSPITCMCSGVRFSQYSNENLLDQWCLLYMNLFPVQYVVFIWIRGARKYNGLFRICATDLFVMVSICKGWLVCWLWHTIGKSKMIRDFGTRFVLN